MLRQAVRSIKTVVVCGVDGCHMKRWLRFGQNEHGDEGGLAAGTCFNRDDRSGKARW